MELCVIIETVFVSFVVLQKLSVNFVCQADGEYSFVMAHIL